MNAQIDPYLDWLQISADRRPPTHYDLLGLPAIQADAASAHAAATRRIAHVRKFQLGVHSDVAIRVMGEISRALTCLSDPVSKRQYDAQLRGTATIADDDVSMDTRLEEPLTSQEPTPTAEDEGNRIEPLPLDLAGSSPNSSLDKLTALVNLVESPPQSELQPVGVVQPAVAAAQQPLQSSPALQQNTRILVAAASAVAATLLLLAIGGWMLSGSKTSNQAAGGPEPSLPPDVSIPTLTSEPDVIFAPSSLRPEDVARSAPSGSGPSSEPPPAPPAQSPLVAPVPLPMPPAREDPGQTPRERGYLASPAQAGSGASAAAPVVVQVKTPAAEIPLPIDTFQKAYDEWDSAVDQAAKDKKSSESKWQPVLAQLAVLEQGAQDDSQRKAVKRMRRRLADVADRLLIEAKAERKDFALYQKYLREAILLDPSGDAGKKARQMLGRSAGFGF